MNKRFWDKHFPPQRHKQFNVGPRFRDYCVNYSTIAFGWADRIKILFGFKVSVKTVFKSAFKLGHYEIEADVLFKHPKEPVGDKSNG